MPKIYLYAEVLTHLRQLTVHASLQTDKNEETKIEVSSDKKIITLVHDGESSSLYLPTQISGTGTITLSSEKKTELSARVQIDDLEQWKETDVTGIEAPWNASELSFETTMRCVNCDITVLHPTTISAWKDLPNQNWAEVMDLWFCHKPHENHDDDQQKDAAKAKGYSAQSKLTSKTGVGLVDLVSFALHPDDCSSIKIIHSNNVPSTKPVPVQCLRCKAYVGAFSSHDNLIRLDKASVRVKSTNSEPFVSYSATTFISAQLLELIESTAIRKVVMYSQSAEHLDTSSKQSLKTESAFGSQSDPHSHTKQATSSSKPAVWKSTDTIAEDDSPTSKPQSTVPPFPQTDNPHSTEGEPNLQPIILWIFNPDIYYSSSSFTTTPPTPPTSQQDPLSTQSRPPLHPHIQTQTLHPHRALKIFYQPLSSPLETYLSPTSPQSQQYESLPLPPTHLATLRRALQRSNSFLPVNARTFSDWKIGLLDRYERRSTAEHVMGSNPLARRTDDDDDGSVAKESKARVTSWEVPLSVDAKASFG